MAKLARLPPIDRSEQSERNIRVPRLRTRFYAFLSYSHKDKELADWLHRELERFRVPHSLAGKLTANGVVPRRLTPIFRDQHDLSAGGDLADEIKAALAASQFLVVLCSPTAATSRWTNQEIESFKRTRPEGCVLAAVASGEPFASEIPGREGEECFPPALRYKYDRRGHQTLKRADPLAADFREVGEGKRLAFLKLVAGMLGVGLDELVRREQTRHQRHLAYVAAASIAGMAITSTLAVSAFQARNEAREQRREAEGLVAFMLGDLRAKLEPIGRLDALDGVGARVLAYYSKQDTAALTDSALTQRSKALSLMAEVADARGDTTTALKLYRQALTGTAEAIRRRPGDPQALFEHAQNMFYVGQIAQNGDDLRTAEASMREYQRLARNMVAMQPDSMKYRMEEQYADADLGVVLYDQRKFADAASQFDAALSVIEAIATAAPSDRGYRQGEAESLAWLADSERALGHLDRAIGLRQRNVAIYNQLFAQTGDVKYREHLIPALRALGNYYAEHGQTDLALSTIQLAVSQAGLLTAVEPGNSRWREMEFRGQIDLASLQLKAGQRDQASALAASAFHTIDGLLRHPAPAAEWRIGLGNYLMLETKILLSAGFSDQALQTAQKAVTAVQSAHSVDKLADSYRVARANRVLGDVENARGNIAAARSAWMTALSLIPADVPELPDEIAEHAAIFQRLGRSEQAMPLIERLGKMGFRSTPFP